MKSFTKLFLSAAVVATAMTGCSDNDDGEENLSFQSITDCYVVKISKYDPTHVQIFSPVSMEYVLNWTSMKCEATISGQNMGALHLSDMKWTSDNNGWGKINAKDPITSSVGASSYFDIITNFKMEWLDRLELLNLTGIYSPVAWFEYDLGTDFHIVGAPQPTFMGGTTTSTCPNVPAYSYDDAIYNINLDFSTMKATVKIIGAKFNERMRALNMEFRDIDIALGETQGSFILSCDNLLPYVGELQMEDFPISNFEAEVYPGHDSYISFNCTPATMPMTFTVTATVNGANYKAAL